MNVKLYDLASLIQDMYRNNQDIEHFSFKYASIEFDTILDISIQPYELMIGAREYLWACVLQMKTGYSVEMPDQAYYELRKLLTLNPNSEPLTSIKFLRVLAAHAPRTCSRTIVNPQYLLRFRASKIKKSDEPEKTIFIGWNDHIMDGRKAQNFDKTQLLLGKKMCRLLQKA